MADATLSNAGAVSASQDILPTPDSAAEAVPDKRLLPPLRLLGPVGMFLLFLLAWKAATTLFQIKPFILPSPEAVIQAFVVEGPYLLRQLGHTVQMAVSGFVLAAVIGVSVAILFSQSRLLEYSLYPYAILLQTTPIIAIAPLIVIWAGIGDTAVIVISFIIALFPIIANTTLGLTSVDNSMLNLFRMNNASRWQELLWLRLPFAVPYMFSGFRISTGLAVIGAIVGEFLVGTGGFGGGMGYTLIIAASQLKTAMLFAAVMLCALLGICNFLIVSTVGNLLLRNWHESAVQHEN
jgi:NitT/TauT family transport system permease protein